MKIKIITDPGSCHLGDISKAKELIKISAYSGADACKFQLFKESKVNIPLPYEWFPELVDYGRELNIEVFASAFDVEAVCLITKHCKAIKLSYSMRQSDLIDAIDINKIDTMYISSDTASLRPPNTPNKIVWLYCIPIYPVPYIIDFEGVFERFDGFSDHTLGINQTLSAVKAGARFIEKHIQLNKWSAIPDAKFALIPKDLDLMVKNIRKIECTA